MRVVRTKFDIYVFIKCVSIIQLLISCDTLVIRSKNNKKIKHWIFDRRF